MLAVSPFMTVLSTSPLSSKTLFVVHDLISISNSINSSHSFFWEFDMISFLPAPFFSSLVVDPLHHASKNGEHFYGETCIMLLRMGSTPVWRVSMEKLSTHTTSTSLVVPIRAYKRLNIFAILSIASFLLDLNIKPPRYMNTSQRGTSNQTNTWTTLMHSASM